MSEVRRATLHLKVLGEVRKVGVEVGGEGVGLVEGLLPAARAMTDAVVGVAVEKSEAGGERVSCQRGCAACCYQLVAVTVVEARALLKLVEGMSEERRGVIRGRFAETARRARRVGVVRKDSVDGAPVMVLDAEKEGAARYLDLARRYIAMGMPCGFLEGGECGIYEDRPLVCREYLVSSPAEYCKTLEFEGIKPVGLPVKISEGLGEVGAFLEGRGVEEVPLFAALAWAERERLGGKGEWRGSGVEMLKGLAHWVDRRSGESLEGRGGE